MCYGPRILKQARLFPVVLALFLAAPAFAAEKTVAVFDFELIDSSLEGAMIGTSAEEQTRLATMAPALRDAIAALDGFVSVDIAPVREKALAQNLQSCGRCALRFAETLGAEIAVTGTVQKVSNLILNINAYAFDVASGRPIARGSVDIRSNTDESWRRGIAYLWKNVLKTQFEAAP